MSGHSSNQLLTILFLSLPLFYHSFFYYFYLSHNIPFRGRRIPEGAAVHILFASANRDEAVFERPDEVDFDRSPNRHLAFGFGVHFCLGAKLARLEARVALEELVRAMPAFELACERVPRARSPLIRGLSSLPVRLLAGSPPPRDETGVAA